MMVFIRKHITKVGDDFTLKGRVVHYFTESHEMAYPKRLGTVKVNSGLIAFSNDFERESIINNQYDITEYDNIELKAEHA